MTIRKLAPSRCIELARLAADAAAVDGHTVVVVVGSPGGKHLHYDCRNLRLSKAMAQMIDAAVVLGSRYLEEGDVRALLLDFLQNRDNAPLLLDLIRNERDGEGDS